MKPELPGSDPSTYTPSTVGAFAKTAKAKLDAFHNGGWDGSGVAGSGVAGSGVAGSGVAGGMCGGAVSESHTDGIAPPPVEDTIMGDPHPARSLMTKGYATARTPSGDSIDMEGGSIEGPAPSSNAAVNALPAAPRAFWSRSAAQEYAQRAAWGAPLPNWFPQGSQKKLEDIPAHGVAPLNGSIIYNFDARDGRPAEPIAGMAGKTGGKKRRVKL